jgi:hydrophobe/amphiphile efflux-3 (HAE3) family protein
MTRRLQGLAAAAARHPVRVLVVATLTVAVALALALRLEPSAATDTLVDADSASYEATERYRDNFGDHAIVVLVRGDLQQLVLTPNLGRMLGLEGCLSGNKPPDKEAPGGPGSPCDELAKSKPVQVVYGPGTFINAAVGEIQDQFKSRYSAKQEEARRAARAARKLALAQGRSPAEAKKLANSARSLVLAEFVRDLLQVNVRYGLGLTGLPQLNDPDFVSALVFDPSRCATCPKSRFAYLFPNQKSAVIQVRLKPDLTDEQRSRAIALVRQAVGMDVFSLDKASYTVTGAPVVVEDLTSSLSTSILRLLVIALLVMALALAVVFRARLRLLPLALALGAVAITYGAMSLLGASLTMASIAVLPVLLGLGVDYAIQYQARADDRRGAAAIPAIATACLATGVGFLVLLLSPVPMVRGFGVLLVAGIAIAFLLALTAGTAALSLRRPSALAPSLRGAAEIFDAGAARVGRLLSAPARLGRRVWTSQLRRAVVRPGAVLAVGLVLALGGWAVDSQTEVISDVTELVPQDLEGLRDLGVLQDTTDVGGEINVIVESDDLTDPAVVSWMRDYQSRLLKRFGYTAERGCGRATLCPALSLPDLFRSEAAAKDENAIRALLDAVPPYFSQAVITGDRRTANLAFGIRLMPLERQKEVVDAMRAELDPPKGVRAELAGLPVLAAEANAALASPLRRLGTLAAGLMAVLLALFAVYRRWERAWIPLVPIAMATGWSALVLFALQIPLNPMSATLGALVIAISTEFSVLLTARYREERSRGYSSGEALRRTYASTGAAVLASGVTAIAGFAVLAFSDVRMLQEFGLVTVIDLTVSLLGVLAVLPAVLTLAERRAAKRRPPAPPERERELIPA